MNTAVFMLILGDLILSLVALHIGLFIKFRTFQALEIILAAGGIKIFIFVFALIFSSFFVGLYNYENGKSKKETLVKIFFVTVLSFITLSAVFYIVPEFMLGRGIVSLSIAVFGVLQFLLRISYKICLNLPAFARRVLIIGTGPLAKEIGSIIASTGNGYVLSGYVNCSYETAYVPSHFIKGNGDDIIKTAISEKVHKIVVSLSDRRGISPLKDLLSCKLNGIEVTDAPSFYEELTGKLLIENITPSWLIFSDGFRITQTKKVFKGLSDVIFSAVGLIIALPLILVIALLIKIDSPGPVFFRQVRIGEKEKEFILYKFRTMRRDAESKTGAVWAQKNDPRVTKIGRLLRKTRLDEIPQLYNVLKGDMSFIGPRPERPEFVKELKEIIPFYSERHFIKPGITGWAQVKYPYGASVQDAIEKLRYDLFYVKHLSLSYDLLIMLETIKVVLFGRGGR